MIIPPKRYGRHFPQPLPPQKTVKVKLVEIMSYSYVTRFILKAILSTLNN